MFSAKIECGNSEILCRNQIKANILHQTSSMKAAGIVQELAAE